MKTTLVGSLPFTEISEALDYTFLWDVPTLFTLPQKEAFQFMGIDVLSLLNISESRGESELIVSKDYFKRSSLIQPFYLDEFLRERERRVNSSLFKYQLIGPVTLYSLLKNKDDIIFSDFTEYLLESYMRCLENLSSYGEVLFSLDEPCLSKDISFYNSGVWGSFINETSSKRYIHCCDKIELNLENKSFEKLHLNHSLFHRDSQLPESFIGIDPLDESWNALLPKLRKSEAIEFISPSCGLALATKAECMKITEKFREIK